MHISRQEKRSQGNCKPPPPLIARTTDWTGIPDADSDKNATQRRIHYQGSMSFNYRERGVWVERGEGERVRERGQSLCG